MISYYLSDTGRVRSHNEDSVKIIKKRQGCTLMVLADGMGGHKAGEVASLIAVNKFEMEFKNKFTLSDKISGINWIRKVVNEINKEIFDYVKKHPEAKGMGTTLVLSLITDKYILIGNIGDSSGYLIKNNKLHKITHDHSLVNLLVQAGEIQESEVKIHPKRNILMKALGANNPIEIDIFDCDLDIEGVLLASDGLTNMLEEDEIMDILSEKIPIQDRTIRLIEKANNRGGTDNISVAYVIMKG